MDIMNKRKQLAGFFDMFIIGTKGISVSYILGYGFIEDLHDGIRSQVPRHVDRMLAAELKQGGL